MGFLKIFIKSLACLFVIMLFLAYMPGLLNIEPQSYKVQIPDTFTGALAINSRLNDAEVLFKDKFHGAESLAAHGGKIYTGIEEGWIVELDGNKMRKVAQTGEDCSPVENHLCGRPLGLRFDKEGTLYVADAFQGILAVDVKTGKVETLLPITTVVSGKKLVFPDDLDIDSEGIIYFSDLSTKWSLDLFVYSLLERKPVGRVLAFNKKTKEIRVIMDNLHTPNGIQITSDGNYLLVAEWQNYRILKYHLKGNSKGTVETLLEVPGEPDNIRVTQRGTYWVALSAAYNSTSHHLLDYIANLPLLRKIIARACYVVKSISGYLLQHWSSQFLLDIHLLIGKATWYVNWWPKLNGAIIEFDAQGNIIQSLYSPDGRYRFLSEVLEHGSYLYIGSFTNPYILRVKGQK